MKTSTLVLIAALRSKGFMWASIICLTFLFQSTQVQAQAPNLMVRAGSTTNDGGFSTAVDASGNVYVVGAFTTTATFGTTTLTSAGSDDIFIAKYNRNGVLVWVKRAGGTGADFGFGIAVSGTSVYITGSFQDIANFNTPTDAGSNMITSAGGSDVFVAKLTDAGAFVWARRAGSTTDDLSNSIAVSGTSVYITGVFQNTANFNTPTNAGSNTIVSAGGNDIFIAKFTDAGAYVWAKRAGSSVAINQDLGTSITVSGASVYVTGHFQGAANFNTPSDAGSNTITSVSIDIFVAKFTDAGALVWVRRAGGSDIDAGYGIAVSGTSVYVTGVFQQICDFNTPTDASSNTIMSQANTDMFVAKFTDAGAFVWARRGGGPSYDQGLGIALSGTSVYVTGDLQVKSNFLNPTNNNSNSPTHTATSAGQRDIFVAKYSNSGDFEWVQRAGGTANDQGYSIAISGDTLYVAGRFSDIANFNTPSNADSNTISSAGNFDMFLARYIDGTIWNGSVWSNGIPKSTINATIDGNYSTTTNGNIRARSIVVNSGDTLFVANNGTINAIFGIVNNGVIRSCGTITGTVTGNAVVSAAPTLPIISGTPSFCTGNNTTLSVANPAANTTYLWSNNTTANSITVNAAGSFTVQAISNGCSSAVSAATLVSVTAAPTLPIISGTPSFCTGNNTTLSVANPAANTTYLWSNNTTANSITVNAAGSFTVRAISNGCSSAVSAATLVSVTAAPTATITQTANSLSATLVANATYQWLLSGQPIANATSISYIALVSGAYSVRVTLAGCDSVSNQINVIVTGISNKIDAWVKVYPNPSSGIIHVETEQLTDAQISVIDALGRQILSQKAEAKTTLHLPKGFYMIKIQNRMGINVQKVVVQ